MSNETKESITEQLDSLDSGLGELKPARKLPLKGALSLPNASIFLWGWFFVSFVLLAVIAWNFLQERVYSSGLQTGSQQAAAQIYTDMINKAANDQCNTIFVQYDNKRVDLINVRCLQILSQNPTAENTAAAEKTAKKE